MPNYEVNLQLALKGATEAAQKIKDLRKNTKELDKDINRFNRSVNKSMGRKKGEGSFVYSFQTLSKEVNSARAALNKAAIGTEEFNKAIKNVVEVEETYNDELKKRDRALRIQRIAQQKGISLTKAEIELEKQLALAKEKTARKERNKRFGQTISSAAIGGAFPLLFGQTGAAAVGGGLGGLAGGAIGGQFGFALSIVGTALGAAIDKNDKFNQSLAALNVQFTNVSGGAQLTAEDIDKVAKRLRITKEEAFGVLGAFSQFGSGSIAKSLTEIFGSDAGAFGGIAGASRQAQLANQIFEARQKIGIERAIELQQQNLSNKAGVVELALAEARAQAENDIAVAQAKQIKFSDRAKTFFEEYLLGTGGMDASRYGEGRADKLNKEFEANREKRLENFTKALEKYRELLGLTNEAQGQFGQSGTLAFSAIEDKVKDLQDEMKMLTNPIYQVISLSESMASSFEQSFKGIITGSMTAQEALRNLFQRTADHFADMAAKMIAKQIQMQILGIGFNFFGHNFGSNPYNVKSGQSLYDVATPSRFTTKFDPSMKRANGGPVTGGSSYLVGERGPELFTPGRSGMITSNENLGSTNIVVNVDASGSSVEGDGQQGEQLGALLATTIRSTIIEEQRPGGLLS